MLAAPATEKSPRSAKYGPFEYLDPADELWDQEVGVGVTVAVRVRRQVDRHAGNRRREVRAVIQVEAAQIVLVGFPFPAVLADDQPGYGFQQLTGPHDRPRFELLAGHGTLARGECHANEVLRRAFHVNELRERALAGDGDIRRERQMQRRVDGHRLGRRHHRVPADGREVHQPEEHRIFPDAERVESIPP